MSILPKDEIVDSIDLIQFDSLVTSSLVNKASPPESRIWLAVFSPSYSLISAMTTFAPSCENSHAVSPPNPINWVFTPEADPVINAILFLIRILPSLESS